MITNWTTVFPRQAGKSAAAAWPPTIDELLPAGAPCLGCHAEPAPLPRSVFTTADELAALRDVLAPLAEFWKEGASGVSFGMVWEDGEGREATLGELVRRALKAGGQ